MKTCETLQKRGKGDSPTTGERNEGDNEVVIIPRKFKGIRKCSGSEICPEVGGRAVCDESCKHGSEGGQGFLRVRLPYPTGKGDLERLEGWIATFLHLLLLSSFCLSLLYFLLPFLEGNVFHFALRSVFLTDIYCLSSGPISPNPFQ